MPNLIRVEIPIEIQASQSDILNFNLREGRKVTVDFLVPFDPKRILRLEVESIEVVRLLDEMALSTESDTPMIGHVPENIAYEVIGSAFWSQQSEALRLTRPKLRHYRFVTGWTCLDILTEASLIFEIVECN